MAHLLTIAFFLALLVALGMILEFILKESWVEIRAALAGAPTAPAKVAHPRLRAAQAHRHAAA